VVKKKIRKVAILGSGTMGGGISAQLANAGIPSYLLDIVPREFTEKEKAQGLTEKSPAFRNKIAEANKAILVKSKPAALMSKEDAALITTGNMEDNLAWLSECDWVVEVVPENIAIKKSVLKQIAPFIKPGTFVTSNTSSISINSIVEDMPLEFKQYWMGTHFFNPVRYMKLLELIPGKDTLPEVVEFLANFGERVMGKGIVYAKDTPAFVANRLGNWAGPSCINLMLELGLTVPEVDALTGSAIGRPGTGTFGLFDMVGVDIAVLSTAEVMHNVTDPAEKAMYTLPAFCQAMLDKKLLGAKTKGGFYKRVGKEKQVIDVNTFEYGPIKPASFASLDVAKKEKGLDKKLAALFDGDDKASQFIWKHVTGLFLYAASKIPEVSDDILNMDRALCWGYNHTKGPFEIWSGMDLEKYLARMEAEGQVIPAWIKEMLAAGIKSFYKTEAGVDYYYSIPDKKYLAIEHKPEVIVLKELNGQNKVIKDSAVGTLYDIGDEVVCLELHTKTSAISAELIQFMAECQEELAKNWEGMVVAGAGKNFCVGADLSVVAKLAAEQKWDLAHQLLAQTQAVYRANKYSDKPVVMAVHGMVLGGGCEMTIQGSAIQAAGESYIGLVEMGVGLIPAGGGIREAVMRTNEVIKGTTAAPVDIIMPYFQNIAMAKVATSAKEAVKLGYLRPTDGITLNPDYLITDAKNRVLDMIKNGYKAPLKKSVPSFGQTAMGLLKVGLRQMAEAGAVSQYDRQIANGIVDVMAGGELIRGTMIPEEYLDELEIEVFISLCKEQKTQDRIAHMLKTGKPLRN
jgi:3-hydroxyacyl-CoA dehydrogenase